MTQFKVGDKVRRISCSWEHFKSMRIGDIDTVKSVEPGFTLEKYGHGHDRENFELVSENNDMFCSQCNFKSNCLSNCPSCGCNLVYKSSEKIIESKTYKFKVGDKVRKKSDETNYCTEISIGSTGIFMGLDSSEDYAGVEWDNPDFRTHNCGVSINCDPNKGKWVKVEDLELVKSNQLNTMEDKMTTKTVYNVLVVNKKTGEVEKDDTVVASNEREAILKAYGVDIENVVFKITQRVEYEEEKPKTVVLEKSAK